MSIFSKLFDEELPRDLFIGEEEEEEEEDGDDGGGDNGGEGGSCDDGDSGDDGAGASGDDGAGASGDNGDSGSDGDEGDSGINADDFNPEERGNKGDSGVADDGDDDIDPEDKAQITKVVNKELSPLKATIQKQNDEIEVNSYITEHPEAAKYKPVMMKYLAHPTYKNIPVKNIAAIVMSGEMQKIGAAKERAAQKKVLESKGGNGSHVRTPAGGAKDYAKLSDKEMEAEIAKAKGMTG